MKLKTFAIKDKALDAYGATFQQPTIEAGYRMFENVILYGDENNRYKKNPEDYTLYFVGEYDDATGELINKENIMLSSAIEVITKRSGDQENVS